MPPKRGIKRKGAESPELSDGMPEFGGPDNSKRLYHRDFEDWARQMAKINRFEAAQSKEIVKKFSQKAEKHKKQLEEYLKDQEEALKKHHQRFLAAYKKVYSSVASVPPTRNSASKQAKHDVPEDADLLRQAQGIVAGCRLLIQSYKDTDEDLKTQKIELPTATWSKDKQDIKELLNCGREHGERIIEGLLAPHTYSASEGHEKLGGHEQAAAELFAESRKKIGEDCWGSVAFEQIEGFKGLTETMAPRRER
ncbi:hypothetical protein JX266_000188 [Neoarthrinium moseri]|uniref:uncharacterized protein n=1 Tax=Neoarthrinium moseri TaxID=1658444 RepID=UPI001FDC6023|nr:uncharacterized protein JN550_003094 [Neoarthrinium moseri]KAI1855323.1 hypothetical protein JX266_000188 [Neoarthrinium moseri]KAI1873825.1 hypothetical protein JN550_003094 [Neoarthrinium moseri]